MSTLETTAGRLPLWVIRFNDQGPEGLINIPSASGGLVTRFPGGLIRLIFGPPNVTDGAACLQAR